METTDNHQNIDSSRTDDDYVKHLKAMRANNEKLTPGAQAYLAAKEEGYDDYVAHLKSMQADGKQLTPDAQAYLAAKEEGYDDVGAQLKAKEAGGQPLSEEEKRMLTSCIDSNRYCLMKTIK